MSDESARSPQALREEEAFLALAETLSALIALIQGDKLIYVNPAGAAILGYPQEYYKGRNFWDFAHPEDREMIIARGRARQMGIDQARRFTERLRHADGHVLWVDYSVDVIQLNGKVTTLVTGHDITERKRNEDALRQSETIFRGLFTQSPMMMCSVDRDDQIREISDFWLRKLGFERNELIGRKTWDCLVPESLQRLRPIIEEKRRCRDWQCKDIPLQMYRKDGSVLDFLFSSVADLDERGEPKGWIVVGLDLSEIHQAQKALMQSEERFAAAFQNAAIGKAITDADRRFTQVNRALCTMLGYTEAEMLGKTPRDFTHPSDQQQGQDFIAGILAGKQGSARQIKRYLHKDGRAVWVDMTASLVRDAEGKPAYYVTEIQDITERKQAEELLRDRESRLAEAQRIAKIGRWEWDIEKDVVTWSEELYRLWGIKPEEFKGNYAEIFSRVPEDDRERVGKLVAKAAQDGKPVEFEHRLRRPDGEIRHTWSSCIPVRNADGRITTMYGLAQDITERKRNEVLIRDREAKLAEAQGVAHIGSWEYHIDSNTSEWSEEMYRLFGVDPKMFNPSKENAFARFHPDDLPEVSRVVENAIQDGNPFEFDARLVHDDGKVLNLHAIGRSHRHPSGKPASLYGVLQDVTERVRAEELLRDREAKLAEAQRISHLGSWEYDIATGLSTWSDQMYRIFGVDRATFTPRREDAFGRIHPDDRAQAAEHIDRSIREKTSFEFELRAVLASGEVRHLWTTGRPVLDASGSPIRLFGVAQDVTDRKRADELLRDREASLAEAQRIAHIGSWEWDVASGHISWSDELFRILGLDPATSISSYDGYVNRIHPDDRADVVLLVERALHEARPYESEHRIVRDNGEVRMMWASCRLNVDAQGKTTRMYGIAQDITDRKRSLEALRSSEQRFRSLYSQAPVMMTAMDPEGRIREVSNYWLRVMGYEREEVIGHDGFRFITAESKLRLEKGLAETLLSGERVIRNIPLVGVRKDGSTLDVLVTSVLETTPQGQPVGAIVVGIDVSDIRRAEEAVRESEARYRALVEHAPEAIVVLDVETGKFIDLNANAETLFGYTREQLLMRGPLDICRSTQPGGRRSSDVAWDQIGRVMRGETAVFEFVHVQSSGREIPCQVRFSRMPATGQNLIRATLTDISDQKALEEKVRHAEKMAAIGLLAAGVAHEIGNPLLALSMAAQSLERRFADEYAQKKLGLIREHIDRISKIVRQMSDLARPQSIQKSPCDVNRVLERAVEIVRYDRRAKEVPICFEGCPDIPFVQGVEDQLMQVCLNLALNALDAVASNPPTRAKSLRVSARCVTRDGRKFVRASFLDSGPGIPEESRSKIFQPFFTTKSTGKGTGLGLSVSYRIIEEHRGTLAFDCRPAEGTEFYFELPVQEKS